METLLITCFVAGALGSLAKDIVQDNSLRLPQKRDSDLVLGFLGGMVTGGIAGYLIDGAPTTAFLAGYSGTSIIENLLLKKDVLEISPANVIEALIKKIAKEEGVDPDLAARVAKAESKFNPEAKNTNSDGSKDRGLYQINNKWHPEVSDEQAFDPIFSTHFFCKAFKEGHLDWWDATEISWKK